MKPAVATSTHENTVPARIRTGKRLLVLRGARAAALYVLVALAATSIPFRLLKIANADLTVPLEYVRAGDGLLTAALAKNVGESGWYLFNSRLGAPGIQDLRGFPMSDSLHLVCIRFLSAITGNPLTGFNLYFLLSFPAIAVSALYVFRRHGIWWPAGAAMSILYALLPFRYLRGTNHLFLSSYYVVPIACLIALWLSADAARFPFYRTVDGHITWNKRLLMGVTLLLIAIGSSGVYFAAFSVFFIVAAGAIGTVMYRDPKRFIIGIAMAVILMGTVAGNALPTILARDGSTTVGIRSSAEAELYGLKIAQMILPVDNHFVTRLSDLKHRYNSGSVSANENQSATLGTVGTIGFLFLVGWALFAPHVHASTQIFDRLSRLNLLGVLVATLGGFSVLIALFATAGIRAYNRISVYIAFFSLAAVAAAVDWIYRRYGQNAVIATGLSVLLGLTTVAGAVDQFPRNWELPHAANRAKFASDSDFVARVESTLDDGAMVFQLPFIPFPEATLPRVLDYEHLAMYLPSRKIHWSYGAMRGQPEMAWQLAVSTLSPGAMLTTLTLRNFAGVEIDRQAYADNGGTLERAIRPLITEQPIVSHDRRYVFYSLSGFRQKYLTELPEPELARLKNQVADPVMLSFGKGAWQHEADGTSGAHWSDREMDLYFFNTGSVPRRVEFRTRLVVPTPEPAEIRFSGELFNDTVLVRSESEYKRTVVLPPGRSTVHLATNAPRFLAADLRTLYFRLVGTSLVDLQAGAVRFSWGGGFYGEERRGDENWRWAGRTGTLEIQNPMSKNAIVMVSGLLQSPMESSSAIELSGLIQRTIPVTENAKGFLTLVAVPPGTHTIRWTSNARGFKRADPRKVYFRILSPETAALNAAVASLEEN